MGKGKSGDESRRIQFRNDFIDLSIKPDSESSLELVEELLEQIAEARFKENSKCRKQRESVIKQQRFIIGRILGNFALFLFKGINRSIYVPVNHRILKRIEIILQKNLIINSWS